MNSSKLNSQDLLENYKHVLMNTIQQELKLDMNEDLIEILQKDYMISKDSLSRQVTKESPENLKSTSESEEGNDEKNSNYSRKRNNFSRMKESSPRKFSTYRGKNNYKPWRDNKNNINSSFIGESGETPSQAQLQNNPLSRLIPIYENKENVRWNNNPNYNNFKFEDKFNNHNTFYKKGGLVTSGPTITYPENPERTLYPPSSYTRAKKFHEK
jgi:hypothetical protein